MPTAFHAFERALRAIIASDAAAYADAFAPDGTLAWPFSPPGWPGLLTGRSAIAEHVGANLARSRAAGRRLDGPYDVVSHALTDTELVVEFAVDVVSATGRDRLPYVHVYTTNAEGFITSLRDYVGPATLQLAERARTAALTTLARQLYAALDSGDWATVAPLLTSDVNVRHATQPPTDGAGWRAALEAFQAAFPDGRHELDEVLVSGDRVITRCRYIGTHTRPFRGAAPSGKRIELAAVHIDRFVNGRVCEHLGVFDTGAIPRA